jgi:hypothetical protein
MLRGARMRHRILQAATDRAERFRPILDEFAALTAIAAAAALNERRHGQRPWIPRWALTSREPLIALHAPVW